MSAISSIWKPWAEAALGFIYPEICQICREARAERAQGYVCAGCWQQVRFIRAPYCERCGLPFPGEFTSVFECANCKDLELHFHSARSAVKAGGMVREVIHRYKYERALWFEPFLADLLIREAAPVLAREPCDLLVPVPLHRAKQHQRDFNQAERLAQGLGRATGIPVNASLLARVESTPTQTRLTREQRAANVKQAFALKNGSDCSGLRIVLVDDVFTTGATTSACAKVLLKAGAAEIRVWTLARGM
jgi:ComF family protein